MGAVAGAGAGAGAAAKRAERLVAGGILLVLQKIVTLGKLPGTGAPDDHHTPPMAALLAPLPQKLLAVDGVLQPFTEDPPLAKLCLSFNPPVRGASHCDRLLQFLRGAHASVQTSCTPPPPLQGNIALTWN